MYSDPRYHCTAMYSFWLAGFPSRVKLSGTLSLLATFGTVTLN